MPVPKHPKGGGVYVFAFKLLVVTLQGQAVEGRNIPKGVGRMPFDYAPALCARNWLALTRNPKLST